MNCYISVERKFLGKILVVDVEDATAGRYLLGFENGQVAYVKRDVYDALLRGEGVTCRMEMETRCWAIVPNLKLAPYHIGSLVVEEYSNEQWEL